MDQIRPAIDWCKRNVFWIGCFLLSAAMIGTWVMAASSLEAAQKKRESEINQRISGLQRVSGVSAEEVGDKAHPNASTEAGMDVEINKTIESIVGAWQKNYDEQKNIMVWPRNILGDAVCDFFSKIEVPEKVADPGFDEVSKAYYDRIPLFMDKICKDLGTNWRHDREMLAKRMEDAKAALEEDRLSNNGDRYDGGDRYDAESSLKEQLNQYPVVWEELNQDLWFQKLTVFQGFDDHQGALRYPTFMQANMLQQDLWLLEAVFKNIKKINRSSISNDTSVIQILDHVIFGREAINTLGALTEVDARLGSSAPTEGSSAFNESMDDPYNNDPYGNDASSESDELATQVAYHHRYVTPNFEPIPATQVKAVLGGATLPATNLELIVAKRVPFRIAMEIDERKINEFIAICANSEFVFEVDQLRINRHLSHPGEIKFNGGAVAGSNNFGSSGDGMEDEEYRSDGGGSGNRGPAAPGGDLVPTPVESRTDFMVSAELYGVVKIYNPVRENFLRLAAGQDVVDDTAVLTEEAPEVGEIDSAPEPPATEPAVPTEQTPATQTQPEPTPPGSETAPFPAGAPAPGAGVVGTEPAANP